MRHELRPAINVIAAIEKTSASRASSDLRADGRRSPREEMPPSPLSSSSTPTDRDLGSSPFSYSSALEAVRHRRNHHPS
jgi:hypothetical protein